MNYKKTKGFDVIEAKGNFKQAEAMPEEANRRSIGGFSDWVFPDMKTLLGLQKISPFKGWVWSSSPYMGFGSGAWLVDFNVGDIGSSYHLGKGHVRSVIVSCDGAASTVAAGALRMAVFPRWKVARRHGSEQAPSQHGSRWRACA